MLDVSSSGSHAFCSAADDLADSGKAGTSPPLFKHVLSTVPVQLLPVPIRPSLARSALPPVEATAPRVALNLRHCVFLI
jgi:hypothetical protein